jgi:GTPase SAR1 family protein
MGYCRYIALYLILKVFVGQERFKALGPNFYRGAKGCICVYNITDEDSFKNAATWLSEFNKHADTNATNVLVGNKCDLNHMRAVTIDEGKQFAQKNNLLFMETSAKDGVNVTAAFEQLLEKVTSGMNNSLYSAIPSGTDSPVDTITTEPSIVLTPQSPAPVQKKGGCCGK